MNTRLRAIAGLLGTSAVILGIAAPASAGTAHGRTEGWAMDVSVPNYTWTKTSGCEEIPVDITTEGWGAERWSVDMDVRHSQSGEDSGWLFSYGYADSQETVDDFVWTDTIQLCSWDAPGTYVVSGTAEYGYDFEYTDYGAPGTHETALSTTFTLSKMSSTTRLNPITSNGNVATISGRLVGNSPKYGQVGVASERVSIQQYVNGSWREVDWDYTDSLGNFSEEISGVSRATPYRVVFAGSNKVSGSASSSVTPTLPSAPKPGVTVKSTSKKSKLHVDVNPNKGKGYWTFQVQKKTGTSWTPVKTYKTKGSKETRTINLPKGTYRVKVNPKYGYGAAYSAPVTLAK